MSRRWGASSVPLCSFPRVSGDEPPTGVLDWIEDTFSPRERG